MMLAALILFAGQNIQPNGARPDPTAQTAPESPQSETVRSAAGRAGQRQTREQIAQDTGIQPMARIDARIQNRVQSRIRNRIDRSYDPQANAASPFVVAGDQARTAGRPR